MQTYGCDIELTQLRHYMYGHGGGVWWVPVNADVRCGDELTKLKRCMSVHGGGVRWAGVNADVRPRE
jgi:hypothetical protein